MSPRFMAALSSLPSVAQIRTKRDFRKRASREFGLCVFHVCMTFVRCGLLSRLLADAKPIKSVTREGSVRWCANTVVFEIVGLKLSDLTWRSWHSVPPQSNAENIKNAWRRFPALLFFLGVLTLQFPGQYSYEWLDCEWVIDRVFGRSVISPLRP